MGHTIPRKLPGVVRLAALGRVVRCSVFVDTDAVQRASMYVPINVQEKRREEGGRGEKRGMMRRVGRLLMYCSCVDVIESQQQRDDGTGTTWEGQSRVRRRKVRVHPCPEAP